MVGSDHFGEVVAARQKLEGVGNLLLYIWCTFFFLFNYSLQTASKNVALKLDCVFLLVVWGSATLQGASYCFPPATFNSAV